MNGYSVEEAAEVLGIPQGRVWELIARGVLAGASEGGASMRVYLRGTTPTPAVAGTEPDETSHANGNGNGHASNGGSHGELSPFRELLTEFRNLTERYGQALLALGEARGEVAALRGRVDLLEARMDMRLPMRAASTVAWEMPAQPAPPSDRGAEPPAPEPPPAAEPAAEPLQSATGPSVDAPATPGGRSRRHGTREAVAGLAEALARAEDPTLSALPGASEAAQALAALQEQVDASAVQVEEPTEPVEASSEEPPPTSHFADELRVGEDLAMAAELDDLAALAPSIELAEEEVAEETAEPAPESVLVEPERELPDEAVAADALMAEDAQADEAQATEAPASPYTTDVIEPDWFADGDFAWLEPAPQPDAPSVTDGPSEPEAPSEPEESADSDTFSDQFAEPDDELPAPVEPFPAVTPESAMDEPTADEIQEAFEEAGPVAEVAEPMPAVMDEPIADEIQDAFGGAGASRAEAIPIEPEESDAAHEEDEPPADEPRAEAGPQASSFGLYRGQPEGPIEAAAGPQPATAVRDEEAVMWIGDDFDAGDLEQGTSGWRDRAAEPPHTPAERAPLQLSDAEIEQLASSEGWDEEEVAAIRGLLGRSERDQELVAADHNAAADGAPGTQAGDQQADTAPTHRAIPIRPASSGPEAADWLQGRRGPAATAYRRLRRIFQG